MVWVSIRRRTWSSVRRRPADQMGLWGQIGSKSGSNCTVYARAFQGLPILFDIHWNCSTEDHPNKRESHSFSHLSLTTLTSLKTLPSFWRSFERFDILQCNKVPCYKTPEVAFWSCLNQPPTTHSTYRYSRSDSQRCHTSSVCLAAYTCPGDRASNRSHPTSIFLHNGQIFIDTKLILTWQKMWHDIQLKHVWRWILVSQWYVDVVDYISVFQPFLNQGSFFM